MSNRIHWQFTLLIVLFVLLISGNFITIQSWISGSEATATIINLAGRQRMLTQKMTKEVLFSLQGVNTQGDLQKTTGLFDKTLKALITGNVSMKLPPMENQRIKAQLDHVSSLWRVFLAEINQVATENPDKTVLEKLLANSVSILKEMNKGVMMMEADAKESIDHLRNIALFFLVVSLFVAAAGYIVFKRRVLSRINVLRQVSNDIAETKNLTKRISDEGNDELSAVATAFDSMVESFHQISAEIVDASNELQNEVNRLTAIADQTRNGMHHQLHETTQASNAMKEMAITVTDVAKNAQIAFDATAQAQEQAQHGGKIVDININAINDLASEIERTAGHIEDLVHSSEAIGGILNTISQIADQTNLLALNAAIEAARAGEQGRGFAVVADEVRTLAQRTQSSTDEIKGLIKKLQSGTQIAVRSMEGSQSKTNQSIDLAHQITDALKSIEESIIQINDGNGQIATAAEQQSTVANDMNTNIFEVKKQSETVFGKAEQSAQLSERLAIIAGQLNARVSSYHL
ncbi:MAG: methyl-accepting chemotaxis protein [Candidatus Thiodiazotropha sp. (ex Ustalcina ferruginea)]|nr:methyl-accepting chemotaxis protein [Candidatus Thiodiazotropha sp. (ex Ustalcina ferruginea)]